MKGKSILWIVIFLALAALAATSALASANSSLGKVRSATAHYHQTDAAVADGYSLLPGLDHCFENPDVGAMGFHYINPAFLDTELDPLRPEAMVYAPGPNGKLQLGAVEYIVPADVWDGAGNTEPPILHGRHLHLNEALGVYVLHAWIWKNNPSGMFEDWNPKVACP